MARAFAATQLPMMVHSQEMTPTLSLLILDAQWRPIERISARADWPSLVRALFERNGRWLALEQWRDDADLPVPVASDFALTRALRRRLRPMDMTLTDHIIRAAGGHFSFRDAGLL